MASSPTELDALIVGAGFGGVYQLKVLRDQGFNVKLVERGSDFGGVWYWHRYPGARVDSAVPFYEFDDPALWKDWRWKQRFPGSAEIRAYFAHVVEKWNLRKDAEFNVFVKSATWNVEQTRWTIETEKGDTFKAKYFLLNTGFAAKRHIPDWKGIERFKGSFLHPSYWPHEEPDLRGKRIAVIGTGSTGVQLAQDLAPVASNLVVFQRTPNTCLPMGQVDFTNGEQSFPCEDYPEIFRGRTSSYGGFDFNFMDRNTFDDSPEERKEVYEKLWKQGDFKFWLANYKDMLFVKSANDEAYRFWRDKTRAMIHDERCRDLLAPLEPPYAFGLKRISLENQYFEIYNESHVQLVDVNATPIEEITEVGIKTAEKEWAFDYIICATGFDAITGGLAQIDIRGTSEESLKDHWKGGTYTYLGMACSGFPNMFFTYGPQAPTALCNGPTCAQVQGDWIASMMKYMASKGLKSIEAERTSEEEWRRTVLAVAETSLISPTKSWYMGDNIPGKPREPYIYLGGVPNYYKALNESANENYAGFKLQRDKGVFGGECIGT